MLEFGTMNMKTEALNRAVKLSGGQAEFARLIGITAQAVSQWEEVPPLRVLKVEQISGVSRYELRPDLYPMDTEVRA